MVGRSGNGIRRTAVWLSAAAALGSVPAFAQSVISARSGLVSLVDGEVLLEGKKIQAKPGSYAEVKERQTLRTGDGRAEVLLNPGVFLRLGERSSIRMFRNRLDDTHAEILTGSAVIEAAGFEKGTAVTIVVKEAAIHLKKAGIYRFDMEPARVRVYAGAAGIEIAGRKSEIGAGKMMTLEGEMAAVVVKFNRELTDALDRWSKRRGEYVAMANVSAAKSLLDSGYSLYSGMWGWNPYFGTYTFIPGSGMLMSPYGCRYWSPGTVGRIYYAPPPSSGSGGWSNTDYTAMSASSSGYSSTAAASNSGASYSSPAASSGSGSAAAASAGSSSVGHGASGGGGRGR